MLSLLGGWQELSSFPPPYLPPWCAASHWAQNNRVSWLWTEALKLWTKITFSFSKLLLSVFWLQQWKADTYSTISAFCKCVSQSLNNPSIAYHMHLMYLKVHSRWKQTKEKFHILVSTKAYKGSLKHGPQGKKIILVHKTVVTGQHNAYHAWDVQLPKGHTCSRAKPTFLRLQGPQIGGQENMAPVTLPHLILMQFLFESCSLASQKPKRNS